MVVRSTWIGAAAGALAVVSLGTIDVVAQQLPLRPRPTSGLPIVPIMEGWWDNGDGSYTISFGYSNRNEGIVEVPLGEGNTLEPARYSGLQPTAFLPGRHHGVFTVTIPAGAAEDEVWWTIESNGEVTRVPGRTTSSAYSLDRLPRPHGTVPPLLWFEEGGEQGQHPDGFVASKVETVGVGEVLTLTAHVRDPSVRDPSDYRFKEPLAVTVRWFKHQGPAGEIEWIRHPSTPVEEPTTEEAAGGRPPREPVLSEVEVKGGGGTALVQARFPVAGEYLLRAQADQFGSAPDSGAGDQCCWTNGYVRVRVTQ